MKIPRALSAAALAAILTAATWLPALAQTPVPSVQTSFTCQTSSTTIPAWSPTLQFLTIQIPVGGNTVCFNFTGATATTAPPSLCYAAGTTATWYNMVGTQLVPGGNAVTCIAESSSQTIVVMYR